VRENVALGLPPESISDVQVWNALQRAQLAEAIRETSNGVYEEVGERGVRLSGGQRQRLGLARAFYSNPRLIVLDEATSALDSETEFAVTNALENIGSDVTVVVIAHRLATVRNSDQVAYLEFGNLLAIGGFDEVRKQVPSFDRQAGLLGL
jgi:ABC-type multidrug transport system fused ATPase/permease subunit